jgi:ferrous iron transport protein B
VGIAMFEKSKTFVFEAGKVILAISIVLWVLASYGPPGTMEEIRQQGIAQQELASSPEQVALIEAETNSLLLENSFIGIMGRAIEPAIQPLGYDWKIGIALITSFAAREVFVGSLATIYAVQDDGDENLRLIDRLKAEKNNKNEPIFTLASGVSLMIFYVFAMQCMATLAVVKRETNSWKWPLIQVGFMGLMAYFGALLAFNLLS